VCGNNTGTPLIIFKSDVVVAKSVTLNGQAKEGSRSPISPPLFVLFVNDPTLVPDSYVNYLCARIREKWEFPGRPILMRLRGREGAPTDVV
jgi:hypothetical protein